MLKQLIRHSVRIYRGISRRLRKLLVTLQLKEVGKGFACDQKVIIYGGENITLGTNVVLNKGAVLQSCDGAKISIGNNVTLSFDAKLITGNLELSSISESRKHNANSIIISDNVWIGANSVILPGVSISKNNIIAAGSVVNKSIDQENALYAGVPAKYIKSI